MGYPARLLNADEELVFDLRPHWKALVGPVLLAPIVVGVTAFALGKVNGMDNDAEAWVRYLVLLAAAVLLFAFCVVPFLKWLTTHFVVTTRRVIMRSGVLSRQGRDLPLYRINDVTFEHSFFERLLRAGTLVVESAGERGQVTLTDIPHPEDVQREVYRLMEMDDQRRRSPVPGDDEPPSVEETGPRV
jgi:uncharacterized membrane protein YdbT with pleckstrin-like domain